MKIIIQEKEYLLSYSFAARLKLAELKVDESSYIDTLLKFTYACLFAGAYVETGKACTFSYDDFFHLAMTNETNLEDIQARIFELAEKDRKKEEETVKRLTKKKFFQKVRNLLK